MVARTSCIKVVANRTTNCIMAVASHTIRVTANTTLDMATAKHISHITNFVVQTTTEDSLN